MGSCTLTSRPRVGDTPRSTVSANRSVLVVEDNPGVRALIQAILEMEGLDVETAADGFQGLARARSRRPTLVILDLNLPVLDGETVARVLLARYGPTLPVVLVSANEDVQEVACRVGADGWLAKPFTVAELRGTVQQALGSAVNRSTGTFGAG